MKLLLTSPKSIIQNSTGKMFPKLDETFKLFLKQDPKNRIVTVSVTNTNLSAVPSIYNPIHLEYKLRGSIKFIDIINKRLGVEYNDIIQLAISDHDFYQAFNSKLMLLSAKYAIENKRDSKFINNEYGISISSVESLRLFFERFTPINNPWYYKLEISAQTTLYSLTDANTFTKSGDILHIANKFREFLKQGNTEFITPFTNFFLVSLYRIFQEVKEVDFWGVFPSSSGDKDTDLEYFLDKTRQLQKKRKEPPPLLVRHTASVKRHFMSKAKRLADACDSQFASIVLNPFYKGQLAEKTICIIDDFTTNGTSCETTRLLLEKEGLKKIIFITMGKFGRTYHQQNYLLKGNLYGDYQFKNLGGSKELTGEINSASNKEFLTSIKDLV